MPKTYSKSSDAPVGAGCVRKYEETVSGLQQLTKPDPKDSRPTKCRAVVYNESPGPIGLKWDGENYSCSYDVFFTVLIICGLGALPTGQKNCAILII